MKQISLLNSKAIYIASFVVCFVLLNLAFNKVSAQVFCANELVYWTENFGTGTSASSHPNVLTLTYQATGSLTNEGVYRVINNTQQKPEWHNSPDHTPGDVNGKMLVVNGNAETFFRKGVTNANGYPAGYYSVSFFAMNINTPGTCAPTPILPYMTLRVEYRDVNNNWIELINSPVVTFPMPQTATPSWIHVGGVFTLPTTGTFLVKRLRFFITDSPMPGCGNDYAIDDLKLASCPAGAPAPVQFLDVTATQKGSGVAINWATASEFNNKYFDIEKSTDGGYNWSTLSTTQSKGNGTTVKNYAGYDAKPVPGTNYYRIKQVDIDGTSKYSKTVVYKLNVLNTNVSVIANPFTTQIEVHFASNRIQTVNCRLFDNTGKQVLTQQMNISKGALSKMIPTQALSRGMYILQVTDDNGAILFSDKLIKQ